MKRGEVDPDWRTPKRGERLFRWRFFVTEGEPSTAEETVWVIDVIRPVDEVPDRVDQGVYPPDLDVAEILFALSRELVVKK